MTEDRVGRLARRLALGAADLSQQRRRDSARRVGVRRRGPCPGGPGDPAPGGGDDLGRRPGRLAAAAAAGARGGWGVRVPALLALWAEALPELEGRQGVRG